MYANAHAAGDEPEEEVFGPVEDGEEVFEWIDDTDTDAGDGLESAAAEQPGPSFRDRMAALRAGGRRLRHSRREIAAVTAAIVLACAIGGGFTAWFDRVADAADRAGVVALTVDSVVDGDPKAAAYDAKQTSATGEYVVEIANNGPEPVTLTSVAFDAGFLGASTGWKPVGSPAPIPGGGTGEVIPGGGIGKAVLTVRLFCPMVVRVTSGYYGSSDATPITFPALHVGVRDGKGEAREVVLPTRVAVSTQPHAETKGLTFLNGENVPAPQIVSADASVCGQWEIDREALLTPDPSRGEDRQSGGLTFSYSGLTQPLKDRSFTAGITVRNTTDHALKLRTHSEPFIQSPEINTTWTPAQLDLEARQSYSAELKITVPDCGSWMSDPSLFGMTMLRVEDPTTGITTPLNPDRLLTGSVRLANDIARQMTVACR